MDQLVQHQAGEGEKVDACQYGGQPFIFLAFTYLIDHHCLYLMSSS